MAVDPVKPRVVLVVHGVQTGDNDSADHRRDISELIEGRAPNLPVRFDVQSFLYEDLNDRALARYKKVGAAITAVPTGGVLTSALIDLVGDVVISLNDGATAGKVRDRLRDHIERIFEAGNPCYLLAHSLGTVYAFDVLGSLMRDERFFVRNSRRTWPVQGLVTLGSPLGLGIFRTRRRNVVRLGEGTKLFRWFNYWDRSDPIVSGQVFGVQRRGNRIAERYQKSDPKQGWVIRDFPTDTGAVWLAAHTAYWTHPVVGDGLHTMITS